MKIKKCRICKKTNLIKLFSLGSLCFTGKFPSDNQKIKKEPITLVLCKNCELVQLGHSFDLKYLYGPDYGYRTGINNTMLNHKNFLHEIGCMNSWKGYYKKIGLKKGSNI